MNLKYKNYIFDLYGTLIDIQTDENDMSLWEEMSKIYSCYGSDYEPDELQSRYLALVREEENEIYEKKGYGCPEIRLERVFARLLTEAERKHPTSEKIASMVNEELMESDWMKLIANTFRTISRSKINVYPGVFELFDRIRSGGGHIYLLSNAQRCFTEAELEETGLSDQFNAVYLSSDYEMKKPQPEFIRRLIHDEGLDAEESVMIGNEFHADIGSALSAGMDSIYINSYDLPPNEMRLRLMYEMQGHPKTLTPKITDTIADLLD
jgi:putative hydrolase of the HAD superfamily